MFTLGGVHMTRVLIMRGVLSLGYQHSIDKLWSHSEHHFLLFPLKVKTNIHKVKMSLLRFFYRSRLPFIIWRSV